MEPYRILLIMSTTRWSRHLGEVALREAEKAATRGQKIEVHVLYIVEQTEIDRLVHRASGAGFLPSNTQENLIQTLLDEHTRVAERRHKRVEAAFAPLGCTPTWQQVAGDYEAEVHKAVATSAHDIVVLVQSKRSFLERLFHGSEDERIARWVRDTTGNRVLVEEGV